MKKYVCVFGMSWGSYAKSVGSFTSGEVEDYDIYISNKEYPKPNPNQIRTRSNPGPTEYCKSAATSPCTAYIRFVELGGDEQLFNLYFCWLF